MATLTKKEVALFYSIHPQMVLFAGMEKGKLKANTTVDDLMFSRTEDRMAIRNLLYEFPELITQFVQKNPAKLSSEQLEIAAGFQHFVSGEFFLMKHLKNYSVLMKSEKAYGVLAIDDSFESFFGNRLPVLVETVLLPFQGKIIYDGLMLSSNIYFGGGIKTRFSRDYQAAKSQHGIIVSLPHDASTVSEKDKEAELLKFYMKSQKNREYYHYEIQDLLRANPNLIAVYHQEIGRIYARGKKKLLKELGLKSRHYAVYQDVVVAIAKNQKELEVQLKGLVPEEKRSSIYIFKG